MIWSTLDLVETDREAAMFGSLYNHYISHIPVPKIRLIDTDFIPWWKNLDEDFQSIYLVRNHQCFPCNCPISGLVYANNIDNVIRIIAWNNDEKYFKSMYEEILKKYSGYKVNTAIYNTDQAKIDILISLGFIAKAGEVLTDLTYNGS